jgi:hypothetical protein
MLVYRLRCPVSNCRQWLEKTDYAQPWQCPRCGWTGDRHRFAEAVLRHAVP